MSQSSIVDHDEASNDWLTVNTRALNLTTVHEDYPLEETVARNAALEEGCIATPYLDGHYFEIDLVETSGKDSVAAICQLCSEKKIGRGPIGSASNFISHLKVSYDSYWISQMGE